MTITVVTTTEEVVTLNDGDALIVGPAGVVLGIDGPFGGLAAVGVFGGNTRVDNGGTIAGFNRQGIVVGGGEGPVRVVNSGGIFGGVSGAAVEAVGGSTLHLVNAGQVAGAAGTEGVVF